MHNPGSVLKNETYKVFTDFEMQMDHLISARRTCRIGDFAVPVDHDVKLKESEKRDK